MPLEIRGAHFFYSECTVSAGNTLRIGPDPNHGWTQPMSISVVKYMFRVDRCDAMLGCARDQSRLEQLGRLVQVSSWLGTHWMRGGQQ